MKCSALNIDFNGVRFDPLGSRSPPYKRIKFGYPIENVQFLLLSTNLAREWLQIGTVKGQGHMGFSLCKFFSVRDTRGQYLALSEGFTCCCCCCCCCCCSRLKRLI